MAFIVFIAGALLQAVVGDFYVEMAASLPAALVCRFMGRQLLLGVLGFLSRPFFSAGLGGRGPCRPGLGHPSSGIVRWLVASP